MLLSRPTFPRPLSLRTIAFAAALAVSTMTLHVARPDEPARSRSSARARQPLRCRSLAATAPGRAS